MKTKSLSANLKAIFALLAVMMLAGCTDGSYKVMGDKVYFTWWTFSFGHQQQELVGADAATFEEVNEWLGKDKDHVWYKERLAEGCDPQTLQVKERDLFCDSKDYYYKGAALHVADMGSFEVLSINEDCLWAKDSKFAYHDSTRIDSVDAATFEVINDFYARDSKHVFHSIYLLPEADPKTFQDLEFLYQKDKNHVWYSDSIMPEAEPNDFQTKWFYGWDSKRVWYNGQMLKDADPKTFEVLESGYYAKDKNRVWFHDEIVKGADAASFKDDGQMIGHDKNQKYVCERLYDLDD